MGEFKSGRVFNKEPASKENHRMGGTQHTSTYWSDSRREKCWRSGLSQDTEKIGLPPVHDDEKIFEILVSTGWG